MQLKTAIQITIGAAGYIAWAVMAFLDPTQRADFLHMNVAMVMGTVGLVLRDMAPSVEPQDKQSGNAHAGLLGAIALGGLLLVGCVTNHTGLTPTQAAQVTLTQGCAAWGATLSTAVPMRQAGKLNKSQIDQVTLLDSQVTPICTGPLPSDPTAAAQQVTAAVTAMAILEAVHQEK